VPTPDRDTYDVLVCHGNVIRWTLNANLGADTKDWANQDSGNGSLRSSPCAPTARRDLVMYSDVGHLPWRSRRGAGEGADGSSVDSGRLISGLSPHFRTIVQYKLPAKPRRFCLTTPLPAVTLPLSDPPINRRP